MHSSRGDDDSHRISFSKLLPVILNYFQIASTLTKIFKSYVWTIIGYPDNSFLIVKRIVLPIIFKMMKCDLNHYFSTMFGAGVRCSVLEPVTNTCAEHCETGHSCLPK